MSHIASRLREAATRRHVMDAVVDISRPHIIHHATSAQPALHSADHWAAAVGAEWRAPFAFAERRSSPPAMRIVATPRTSADFTAQVMARVASIPPDPDPRELRTRRSRTHLRRFARVYLALVIVSGVALVALGFYAPWVLLEALAGIVSASLVAVTLASLVSNATDGVVSGFGVAWVAMLAALFPALFLVGRRTTSKRHSRPYRR